MRLTGPTGYLEVNLPSILLIGHSPGQRVAGRGLIDLLIDLPLVRGGTVGFDSEGNLVVLFDQVHYVLRSGLVLRVST